MSETLPKMRGSARHAMGAGNFSVPIFSHVIDNLWQGCSPSEFPDGHIWLYEPKSDPTEIDKPRFDRILNLYQWGDYPFPVGTERITVEMYDGYDVHEQLDDLAYQVIGWLQEGHRVLVHCQAGLNRSSLVVARVLMLHYDFSADEAIDLIRKQRSNMCLCNDNFRQHLKGL